MLGSRCGVIAAAGSYVLPKVGTVSGMMYGSADKGAMAWHMGNSTSKLWFSVIFNQNVRA